MIHSVLLTKLLILVAIANGTPVLATWLCADHFGQPLDGGVVFIDGRPLFGRSKTVRGIALALIVTPLCALALGLDWQIGALVGSMAMVGDLFSSFLKRRMNLPSSSQALGLDQIPESLFPLLAASPSLSLSVSDIALGVLIFFIAELLASRLLYFLNIRNRPY
jgi:CDP-2,3-bis-(O-geranylgeranyl)-sn-glycerol synthase